MANLDLMSYERDSRWQPHLSWAYPDLTLQQRMKQQAAQREQAWQKIADKLGPLLIGSDIGGSYGQSDYISRDICEDQEYLERAYEKAPLLSSAKYPSSSTQRSQKNFNSMTRSTNYNSNTNTTNNLISQQQQQLQQQDQQQRVTCHQHHQKRNNNNNNNKSNQQQQHSNQKYNNLNLYAQNHHLVQMPQRGQNHFKTETPSYHNSSGPSQLSVLLIVLLFMLLLLLFSLLLFFFYFNN